MWTLSIHDCFSDRSHYAAIKTTEHDAAFGGNYLIDDGASGMWFYSKRIVAPWFEVELDTPVVMTGLGKGN